MAAQMALPVDCQPNGKTPPAVTAMQRPAPSARATSSTPAPEPAPERLEGRDLEGVMVTIGLSAVRLVAALNSYEHMRFLARTAGEGWRAWLLPISVDGLAVVALAKIRRAHRLGLGCGMAWVALTLSLGVSLAANVAAAQPTSVGRLVAAWPPIALLLAEVVDNRRRSSPRAQTRGGGAGIQTSAPHAMEPNTNVDGGESGGLRDL